jgi:hypothetical protein
VFVLSRSRRIVCDPSIDDACYGYAVSELDRLLGRIGLRCERTSGPPAGETLHVLGLSAGQASPLATSAYQPSALLPKTATIVHDGFVITITSTDLIITARCAKGVLNGVYHTAERLGFLFLLPGETGEWAPVERKAVLPEGESVVNPRFAHRGVFAPHPMTGPYRTDEWLSFYAKLRFDTVAHDIGSLASANQRGLRLETGGHGLSSFLPRELYSSHPEIYRMPQPFDFSDRRVNDYNACPTDPQVKKILKENFSKLLRECRGAYAIHAWADDLPGGGWCFCPSCRGLSASDQSLLSMKHLAEAISESGIPTRLAVIAYHDTLFPAERITPAREQFLLFAPRERCYGHRLDDPSCLRNRHYFDALQASRRAYQNNDDAHTFEYYVDQVLFRGMHPFLPDVILGDMSAYEANGIETHLTLQTEGHAVAPDYNMLVFARGLWDSELTAPRFVSLLAERICPPSPHVWEAYLAERAAAFTDAMRLCGHDARLYHDYRWLPETTSAFGRQMPEVYRRSSSRLSEAASTLVRASGSDWPSRARSLAAAEARRACFESDELMVMTHQQDGANQFCAYLDSGDARDLTSGIASMRWAIDSAEKARASALEAGYPEKTTWYFTYINAWLKREFATKIERYQGFRGL